MICTRSSGFLPDTNIFESSAKKSENRTLDTLARSLMYNKNSNGPNMKPWGTPHVISWQEELLSLYTTHCSLSERYILNHCNVMSRIPKYSSLVNRMSWFTVSNALEKSRNSPRTYLPFSRAFDILSTGQIKARSGEWPRRNPNWYRYSNLYLLINDNNLVYMRFSSILENKGNTDTGR